MFQACLLTFFWISDFFFCSFKELSDQHKKLQESLSQVDLLDNRATYNSVPGKKHIDKSIPLKWNSGEDLLSSSKSSPTFHITDSNNNKRTLRKGLSQSLKFKADYPGKSTSEMYYRNINFLLSLKLCQDGVPPKCA